MTKWLSLNTHSWIEDNPLEKLEILAKTILEKQIEVIALQEVNQLVNEKIINEPQGFIKPENEETSIKADNFALLLVEKLKEYGKDYVWSWTNCHVGYDKYDEGVAIVSLYPMKTNSYLVSTCDDILDYRRRMILFADITLPNRNVTVGTCHLSWWKPTESSFEDEWSVIMEKLPETNQDVLLLGDFNNPSHLKGEGYDLVQQSFFDTYNLAQKTSGYETVPPAIDGWKDSTESLRIDFIFTKNKLDVLSSEVIFDGMNYPLVSDHYGVLIESE